MWGRRRVASFYIGILVSRLLPSYFTGNSDRGRVVYRISSIRRHGYYSRAAFISFKSFRLCGYYSRAESI